MSGSWWDVDDALLDRELKALNEAGLAPVVQKQDNEAGLITVDVEYQDKESAATFALRILYPAEYPFYPPHIMVDDTFPKGRHLSPDNTLCLLHDANEEWDRSKDSAASIISSQLPKVLFAHRNPDKAKGIEADVGVQHDGFYHYEPHSVVLTETVSCPDHVRSGTIRLHPRLINSPEHGVDRMVRATVEQVFDEEGRVFLTMNPQIGLRWLGESDSNTDKDWMVPWFRLDKAPPYNMGELRDLLLSFMPNLKKGALPKKNGISGLHIFAFMYPVETGSSSTELSWLFIAMRKKRGKQVYDLSVIRCDHVGPGALLARVPRLGPLAGKSAVIVGAGAIGSTIIMQLARAGVGRLSIVDHDHVSAGNLSRWYGGFQAIGTRKCEFLASVIQSNYPLVNVDRIIVRLGDSRIDRDILLSLQAHLARAIESADVVVDATASWAVSDYLFNMAVRHKKPYLWATGTPGSYGGIVGRSLPESSCGCYY